ncbi:protein NRT1/ PTR FAMILY 1.2-like [Impatiens glandulifera]|uniref:protein NRT1/ PTR FAMILY 1.2-like n=1 Tax=Impatiens glandulifera TaxID=253017 RepID=UPI001FB195E4|nr:protein NRT1/ PTR FAMILY 1.2-like [Impatiens glandulifera]
MIPQAKPPPCIIATSESQCLGPTFYQLVLLCSSFLLMSVGAGGIRSASVAFGAEQLKDSDTLEQVGAMETYLGWYNAMSALSVVIAMTFIVYIQEKFGWRVGFGVPAVLMLVSALSFFMASSLYRNSNTSKSSLMTGLVQVVVAVCRKRGVESTVSDGNKANSLYYRGKESTTLVPSDKLSFFNKACIIEDAENDLTIDGKPSNPWRLCTIDQVEDLKGLIKLIPIWSTGILMTVNLSQNTFPIIQVNSMDRHITPTFQIPAASFTIFMILSMIAWIVIYDRILIPTASKIMGKPANLSPITRIGLGLCFAFLSMVVRASVETTRRSLAHELGIVDDPTSVVPMSAMWLLPQNMLMGVADALCVVGQTELYMSELPRGMWSLSSCLSGIAGGIGGLVAGLMMNGIDLVSKRGGKESWISSNINKGHYDYYCIVLAGVCLVNLGYFIICSRAYENTNGRVRVEKSEEENVSV